MVLKRPSTPELNASYTQSAEAQDALRRPLHYSTHMVLQHTSQCKMRSPLQAVSACYGALSITNQANASCTDELTVPDLCKSAIDAAHAHKL